MNSTIVPPSTAVSRRVEKIMVDHASGPIQVLHVSSRYSDTVMRHRRQTPSTSTSISFGGRQRGSKATAGGRHPTSGYS
jgi:hypothetical protein